MQYLKILLIIILGAFVTLEGCFVMNAVAALLIIGKTFNNSYSVMLIYSSLYLVWFLVAGFFIAHFLKKHRLSILVGIAILTWMVLMLSSDDWVNPNISFIAYLIALIPSYLPKFLIFPVFIGIGLFKKRQTSPNKSLNADASDAGAG